MKQSHRMAVVILFVLALGAGLWAFYGIPSGKVRPSILFVVVDTLGAKHLGTYGACTDCSPRIDAFASQSVVFERAYSTAPWTKPSIASMFTGKYPTRHSVRGIDDKLPPTAVTLAELLREQGYATGGVISHTLIDQRNGYEQGFDRYGTINFDAPVHEAISSRQVTDDAITWLKNQQRDSRKPYFLFVHYFDPHYNYRHHEEFDRTSEYKGDLTDNVGIRTLRKELETMADDDVEFLRNLYREEIQFTDHELGRLLDFVDELSPDTPPIIVFTADHGEEFMEHDYIGHGRSLFEELVHVPLIVRAPGVSESGRVTAPSSIVDIVPTVAELVGFEFIDGDGKSLLNAIRGRSKALEERILFADVHNSHTKKAMVVRGAAKLIYDKPSGEWELFDLQRDPGEKSPLPLVPSDPLHAELRGALEEILATEEATSDKVVHSSDEVKRLETLGYLQ